MKESEQDQESVGYYPQYEAINNGLSTDIIMRKSRKNQEYAVDVLKKPEMLSLLSTEQLLELVSFDLNLTNYFLSAKKLTASECNLIINNERIDAWLCLIEAYNRSLNSSFPGFRNIDGLMRAADECSSSGSDFKKKALEKIIESYAIEDSAESPEERKSAIVELLGQYYNAPREQNRPSVKWNP